jgi:DNA polymerase-3 subunit delta
MQSPVYLIHSSEDFLLYEALSSIKDVINDQAGFNFDVYDLKSPDDTVTAGQVISILNTLPFMVNRRAVIIQNIQKLPKKEIKQFEEYIANPSPSSLFVMLHEGGSPKLFSAEALKNIKAIALSVPEKDIQLWIRSKAKKMGIEISADAMQYLIDSTGADLGMLYSEIEKFSSYGKNIIDVKDIKGTVYAAVQYSAFDLINALNRKDSKEVFRIFESVGKNTEPQMLLGALNFHYARAIKENKQEYARIFRLLHEADTGIKTSRSFVIEELLVKLLGRNHAKSI